MTDTTTREALLAHRDAVDPRHPTRIVERCPVCRRAVAAHDGRAEVHDRPVTVGTRTARALCPGSAERL